MLWLVALFPCILMVLTFSHASNSPMLELSCRACRDTSLSFTTLHVAVPDPCAQVGRASSCEERKAMSSSVNATVPSPKKVHQFG